MTFKKAIVIGPSGAGKSTFSRKLAAATGLPLHHLDMIWHKPDRTTVTREEFDAALETILMGEKWIIDGHFNRTLERRLLACDTVFFLDLSLDKCLAGVESRIGKERPDMPWQEQEFDPEFKQWIIDFHKNHLPELYELLEKYRKSKTIISFKSHEEADAYIEKLQK